MKDDQLHILHILESIAKIEAFAGQDPVLFKESQLIQDAVFRNLQVLGESTQNLSEDIKSTHPEINWKWFSDMRNALVHDYLSVDVMSIFDVIRLDLSPLKRVMLQHQQNDSETL